jgi:epoxyqueuosine reductase
MPVPQPADARQPAPSAGGADLVAELRREAERLGFSRVGIAAAGRPPHHDAVGRWLTAGFAGVTTPWMRRHEPLRADPATLLPGVRSIVMLATDHATTAAPPAGAAGARDGVAPAPPDGRGRIARYAWGEDYHDLLRDRGSRLAAWLESRVSGSRARAVVDSAPLAERDFAWLAGLGWFGKNTMLIHPRAGSFFLLTGLLTDVDLPADTAIVADHCGTCTACLDACPTDAFPEAGVLDAGRCVSAVSIEDHGPVAAELREGVGDWVFGCDICQEVCPWNRHAPGSAEPAFQARDAQATLPLAPLLRLDDRAFREHFRGSPVLRAKRRGLARTAAIVLGNRPHLPSLPALVAALDDVEPVVRAAAAWALGRWIAAGVAVAAAREAVAGRLAVEPDGPVREDLAAAVRAQPAADRSGADSCSASQSAVSSTSADGSRPGPSSA